MCIENPQECFDEKRIEGQKRPIFICFRRKRGIFIPFKSDFAIPTDIPLPPQIFDEIAERRICRWYLKEGVPCAGNANDSKT